MSCTYCRLKTSNHEFGEKSNGYQLVESLDTDLISSELYFNRYKIIRDGISNAELILSMGLHIEDCIHNVKDVSIPIKYCPFCGEEL